MTPLNFPSPSLFIFMCAELLFSEEEKTGEEETVVSLYAQTRRRRREISPTHSFFPENIFLAVFSFLVSLYRPAPPLKTPDPVLAIEDVDLAPFSKDPTRGKEFQEKNIRVCMGKRRKKVLISSVRENLVFLLCDETVIGVLRAHEHMN